MSDRRRPRGLVLYTKRWNKEDLLLRRLFPRLGATLEYFLIGRALARRNREYIDRFLTSPTPTRFHHVEIETINRCNGTCSFCPVNSKSPDKRPFRRMEEPLYRRIIDNLARMHYRGGLALYSNNEPLLDKRLPDLAAYAREKLPEAYLKIFTNGTLLTVDRFRQLMPHFNRISVNNYNPLPELLPNVREVCDFCRTPEGEELLQGKTLFVQLRNPDAVLSSRAGNAPNREPPSSPVSALCLYPFKQLIIRPDGKVSLCCNDALGQMTMGDLSCQSIAEVWNGRAFVRVRQAMAEQGRQGIPLCAACDFVK